MDIPSNNITIVAGGATIGSTPASKNHIFVPESGSSSVGEGGLIPQQQQIPVSVILSVRLLMQGKVCRSFLESFIIYTKTKKFLATIICIAVISYNE